MKKEHKFSLFYILLAVWAVLLIQSYIASMMSSQVIPYSQFLKLLKDGKVSEVAITANRIEGKMKVEGKPGEPQPFRTIRVDQDLSELLDKYQVTFKGEVESTFLRDLFSWVFPIIIFFGIWFLLMKKMGGQQAGFMTLGKSKAKIYMENEIKITFKDVAGVDEAKQELQEEIEFLKNPGRFTEIGGRIPKGILLVGPPGRERPSWRKPWRARAVCRSSASAAPSSSRCSSALEQPACATSSSRPSRRPPASSSSTSSMLSGKRGALEDIPAGGTTSVSRR